MLVVENTHDQVVGTVHLVTYENLFVAKNIVSGTQHGQSQEGRQPGKLEECVRLCLCV